jgi:hypothetical protein
MTRYRLTLVLSWHLFLATACRPGHPEYAAIPAPTVEFAAGCYELSWTRGAPGRYPKSFCLLARQVIDQSIGRSGEAYALGHPLGDTSEDNYRKWFGYWWWETRADSVFVIVSNGHTGMVLRATLTGPVLEGVLEGCGDVGPPFCTWRADVIGRREGR